ncbi:hypothetical protein CW311_07385 [Acinetobacter proteolyticus]|uniref:Lipoprotein n=1 Tax=Acinetobacter proteolyticus TaxID=1776741 RepID=A0A2N0WGJ0_9GAMM|nr:hypothetical protein CW311_07385 [Acinetobacter proteolyticus]
MILKKASLFLSLILLVGCAKNEVHIVGKDSLNFNKLNGISLGSNLEDILKKYKNDIVVQNYKDISGVIGCENAKNIIIDNNETNLDVSSEGFITAINTTNPKVVDANGISIGADSRKLLELKSINKVKKIDNQEDGSYYEYKLVPQDSKFYYVYTAGQDEKIDSIGLFSKDHINCYED